MQVEKTKHNKTNHIHQIWNQFLHFSWDLCGREERKRRDRGKPLSALPLTAAQPDLSFRWAGKFLPSCSLCLRNIPPTLLAPRGLPSPLPAPIRVLFKVNTSPFRREILVQTGNKVTFPHLMAHDAPILILGPLWVGLDLRRVRAFLSLYQKENSLKTKWSHREGCLEGRN